MERTVGKTALFLALGWGGFLKSDGHDSIVDMGHPYSLICFLFEIISWTVCSPLLIQKPRKSIPKLYTVPMC